LNPMIKVVNLVSVIIAPIGVQVTDLGVVGWAVVVLLVLVLARSILASKREAPPIKTEMGRQPASGR
ncbi:MAG: hypothetical protein ACRDGG_12380, partial [Anaerolineae bacterium]